MPDRGKSLIIRNPGEQPSEKSIGHSPFNTLLIPSHSLFLLFVTVLYSRTFFVCLSFPACVSLSFSFSVPLAHFCFLFLSFFLFF